MRRWRHLNPDKVKAAKDKWGKTRDRTGDEKAKIYNREYYERNRERRLAYIKQHSAEDLRKVVARNAINDAIRYGRLLRQPCEVCGTTERVEGHHDDYDKPMEVRWLCPHHHRLHHVRGVGAS